MTTIEWYVQPARKAVGVGPSVDRACEYLLGAVRLDHSKKSSCPPGSANDQYDRAPDLTGRNRRPRASHTLNMSTGSLSPPTSSHLTPGRTTQLSPQIPLAFNEVFFINDDTNKNLS